MHEKLRFIRNKSKVPAKEMADLLNLKTEAAYYKKESGHIKFSLSEAKKISEKFGMPIEEIFFDNEVSLMDTGTD